MVWLNRKQARLRDCSSRQSLSILPWSRSDRVSVAIERDLPGNQNYLLSTTKRN